jgi:hypothetical protein
MGQVPLNLTWQWVTAAWENMDADWLGQEIFDIMTQAGIRGDLDNLVRCQASFLTTLCPAGTPTRDCWLWSWRLAYSTITDMNSVTHRRRAQGVATA